MVPWVPAQHSDCWEWSAFDKSGEEVAKQDNPLRGPIVVKEHFQSEYVSKSALETRD
jgi:hypothetical protein